MFVVHDDGAFYFSAGFFEQGEGGVAGEVGELRDDAGGAVGELGVFGGVDVDHEVAVGFAELDHREGGDHVEDDFGGGAGFEAGGAGEDFGAGGDGDVEIGDVGRKLDVGGIGADEEDGFGETVVGFDEGAVNEGGGAAGGDAQDDIVFGDGLFGDGVFAGEEIVFDIFDGAAESGVTAGDEADDHGGV